MSTQQNEKSMTRFFLGLGIFLLSASTVAFVTDPYLMADIALVIAGTYLMATGLTGWRLR